MYISLGYFFLNLLKIRKSSSKLRRQKYSLKQSQEKETAEKKKKKKLPERVRARYMWREKPLTCQKCRILIANVYRHGV